MRTQKRWTGRLALVVAMLACLAMATGCAAERQSALADEKPAETVKGDFAKALEEAQAHWDKRVETDQLEAAIAAWEKAGQMAKPEAMTEAEFTDARGEIYENLARAYYFLADSHIRTSVADDSEVEDEMMATFEKGVTASEKALKLRDPAFAKKVADDMSAWQEAVKEADPAAIPSLYWYSTNLGKWALLEGVATILARKDDIKATMDFICAEQEEYFYGACHRYFGVYWTRLPFGKDAEKSRQAFERALEIAPNYFATRVLMAENLAVLEQDRQMFNEQLDYVLQTPADSLEPVTPANVYEKEKAKRLKKNANELFR